MRCQKMQWKTILFLIIQDLLKNTEKSTAVSYITVELFVPIMTQKCSPVATPKK